MNADKIDITKDFGGPVIMPVVLVGAICKGKPNFFTVGWVSRVGMEPNIWAFGTGRSRYTLSGIREHGGFSINYPSDDLLAKTDYCGIASGRTADKSKLFEVFFGALDSAPMVRECPLAMELKLLDIHEISATVVVFGEIVGIYSEEKYLTDGKLDVEKVAPILFSSPDHMYRRTGPILAQAWKIGKTLR